MRKTRVREGTELGMFAGRIQINKYIDQPRSHRNGNTHVREKHINGAHHGDRQRLIPVYKLLGERNMLDR